MDELRMYSREGWKYQKNETNYKQENVQLYLIVVAISFQAHTQFVPLLFEMVKVNRIICINIFLWIKMVDNFSVCYFV